MPLEEIRQKRKRWAARASLLYLALCAIIVIWSFVDVVTGKYGDSNQAMLRIVFFAVSPLLLLFQATGPVLVLDAAVLFLSGIFAVKALSCSRLEAAILLENPEENPSSEEQD